MKNYQPMIKLTKPNQVDKETTPSAEICKDFDFFVNHGVKIRDQEGIIADRSIYTKILSVKEHIDTNHANCKEKDNDWDDVILASSMEVINITVNGY